jgi:hypothetical protein
MRWPPRKAYGQVTSTKADKRRNPRILAETSLKGNSALLRQARPLVIVSQEQGRVPLVAAVRDWLLGTDANPAPARIDEH